MLEAQIAQRKANGWLATHVGRVMAQQPRLLQGEGRPVWRFEAFLTIQGYSPRGPIGIVDVDAYTGEVQTEESSVAEMIVNARAIVGSLPPTSS